MFMHDNHMHMKFMGRQGFEILLKVLEGFWMNGVETLGDHAGGVTCIF